VIGLVLYAVLFERLGFMLATFLFLVVLFRGISRHRIAVAVGMAAVTALTAWLVFGVALQAQLPRGIFPP
jgi:hypothetical protein